MPHGRAQSAKMHGACQFDAVAVSLPRQMAAQCRLYIKLTLFLPAEERLKHE
jgi:hypothetical protein